MHDSCIGDLLALLKTPEIFWVQLNPEVLDVTDFDMEICWVQLKPADLHEDEGWGRGWGRG